MAAFSSWHHLPTPSILSSISQIKSWTQILNSGSTSGRTQRHPPSVSNHQPVYAQGTVWASGKYTQRRQSSPTPVTPPNPFLLMDFFFFFFLLIFHNLSLTWCDRTIYWYIKVFFLHSFFSLLSTQCHHVFPWLGEFWKSRPCLKSTALPMHCKNLI